MGQPLILVDNLLSVVQHPDIVLTPSQEVEGTGTGEAFRVADGRRWTLWTGLTANTEYSLTWTHSLPQPFDVVIRDRGSIAPRMICEISGDAFGSTQSVFDITPPLTPGAGSVDDALGVVTSEGAWLKRVATVGDYAGRIRIPAMGAGLKPSVTGLWVGLSWTPDFILRPWAPNKTTLQGEWTELSSGAVGRGQLVPRREGMLQLQMPDLFLGEQGAYHLAVIDSGAPFWIIPDVERADRAFLARRRPDLAGLGLEPNWFYEQGQIPFVEVAPLRRSGLNV